MLQEHEQIQLPNVELARGLMGMDVPGEPVAYVTLAPSELARRHHLTFQQSFDNLDSLKIAVLKFASGSQIALVHHAGFPENETELYADRDEWKHHDVVPTVLETLGIPASRVSWRQSWPQSVLEG